MRFQVNTLSGHRVNENIRQMYGVNFRPCARIVGYLFFLRASVDHMLSIL